MSAVAASVAVICVVALTNSAALADAAGTSIEAAPVVVPAAPGEPEATVDDAPERAAAPKPTTDPTPSAPIAEVVPAPAPKVVQPAEPDKVGPSPSSPSVQPSAGPTTAPSKDEAIAEAEASGSWDAARMWAERRGWSEERIEEWIDRLEKARGPLSQWRGQSDDDDRDSQGLVGGGAVRDDSGRDDSGRDDSGRDNSDRDDTERRATAPHGNPHDSKDRPNAAQSSKERPAHAGANADHRSTKPGLGAKKDRSRDSPDRRD
ncbi:hypothetical protein [Microbacterium flavescens]|uniref:hypothetical protein n=1 Tax=Microbacterium flavescens TaxID=69366 RepID=UPI001BDF3CAD|nr:hypothetical protein [Microbacterium flavescens]